MKVTKAFGIAVSAALALMAIASSASATTLETNGVKQTGSVALELSLKSGTSKTLKDTSGAFANTCTVATLKGTTSVFTGNTVSGPISTLLFSKCTHEKVTVDQAGTFTIEWISGTTNGTLRLNGTVVTMPVTILGTVVTATCKTENTVIGTVTGGSSGTTSLDENAVVNCGSFLPSAISQGTWVFTGNHSIGVVG